MLCLPRNLHFEVHQVLYLSRNLHFEVHKVLYLSRNVRFKVHQVLCLPRNLHFSLPRRGSQSATPATKSAHQGSQSAVPATKSANEPHVQKSRFTAPVTKSELFLEDHHHVQSVAPATKTAFRSKAAPIPCTCHGKSTLEHQSTRFPLRLPPQRERSH